jgi:prepilin-type N-terminal cleavage/methylation domain-containing protein
MRMPGRCVHIRGPGEPVPPDKAGFTLLEVLVVLLLLTVMAGVVIPGVLSSPPAPESGLDQLIGSARRAAIHRGETVRLQVERSGAWRVMVVKEPQLPPLTAGQLPGSVTQPVDLIISPLGTCTPARDDALPAEKLDPWTCEPLPGLPPRLTRF